jgi:hypothetical protein
MDGSSDRNLSSKETNSDGSGCERSNAVLLRMFQNVEITFKSFLTE